MAVFKTVYHVVCEGQSEVAYLASLNRFLNENGIAYHFKSHNLRGVDVDKISRIESRCRAVKKDNQKQDIYVWIDYDLFRRKGLTPEFVRKRIKSGKVLFSYENFEDFLAMHYEDSKFKAYYNACLQKNHFITPLHSAEYLKLINSTIFDGDYDKSKLPDLDLDMKTLQMVIRRNDDSRYKSCCDFVKIIERIICDAEVVETM